MRASCPIALQAEIAARYARVDAMLLSSLAQVRELLNHSRSPTSPPVPGGRRVADPLPSEES